MPKYNVAYDKLDGEYIYCQAWMDYPTAMHYLKQFKDKYIAEDGTGKPFPNGKGFYQARNPRIVMKD